jgi:hypothetical protein
VIAVSILLMALHVAPALTQEKPGPTPWREPPPIGGFPGKHNATARGRPRKENCRRHTAAATGRER